MDKDSKIVFVMPWHISERGGGAEVQANYLAEELVARGFQVFYICQTMRSSKINTSEKLNNVVVHYLKPSGRFKWMDQNKYLTPLKKIKPDFILQRMSSNVTYVLGKYCSGSRCKLIWFCTDNKNPVKNFHLLKFKEYSKLNSVGFVKYVIFFVSNWLMDYYREKGMKHIDLAFTQNKFQEEQVKRNFKLTSDRMISGHPLPKVEYSAEDHFSFQTVLWCANFGSHKRPELFIELARQMQYTSLKFIMVGGHSNKVYVNSLLENKPDNLETTGHLPFNEALCYFDKTSIFVNTSKHEGFSNTYIQSWLRRVPVVVFGADSDKIIEKNHLGFDVKSVSEAKEKISNVMNNFDVYEPLSKKTYVYGCENHSIKVMTDNFLNVLESKI